MLLQNLIHYYEERVAAKDECLPPLGYEAKEICFVILLSKKGEFLRIEDTRNEKKIGRVYFVPKAIKRSGLGLQPNYLWDNVKYVAGDGGEEKKKESFLRNLKEKYPSLQKNEEVQAVISFLETDFLEKLRKHSLWEEISFFKANLSFSIENTDRLVCEHEDVKQTLLSLFEDKTEEKAFCLLTGKQERVARIHPLIQGVLGAQLSGASLISYNMEAAESFCKEQGYVAPISQKAAFMYATGLNALLRSEQKVCFDEAFTLVFWSEKKTRFEKVFKKLFQKEASGLLEFSKDDENDFSFFIYGISPVGSRLALRFSWTGSIGRLKNNLSRHFLEWKAVYKGKGGLTYFIQALSTLTELSHIKTHWAIHFLSPIFQGVSYSENVLLLFLRKMCDTGGALKSKMAFIQACLNQLGVEKNIGDVLDESNLNMGYLFGRFFALAKSQETSFGNRSFYKLALISPRKAFLILLQDKEVFLRKHSSVFGLQFMQKLTELPSHFSLIEKAHFIMGYYHQKQRFE